MAEPTVVPSTQHRYYERGERYWNALDPVVRYQNRRATDDPDVGWIGHVKALRGEPFAKALLLNCGNGWVERALIDHGVVREAVGVDISDELLAAARATAAADDRYRGRLHYERVDTNAGAFPGEGYDLVVNVAAGHHIAYLDRVVRRLCELLPDDGWLVTWDYVGPHRNQYPGAQWEAIWQLNQELPPALRHGLDYPDLATMLATDPTEAVHSELYLDVLRRYFTPVHERMLGGWLAYPLLTFNDGVFDHLDTATEWVELIVRRDEAEVTRDPARTLFAYVVSQPNKAALARPQDLARWRAEEEVRERAAVLADGRYYPPTSVAALVDRLRRAEQALAHAPTRAVARELARRVPGARTVWQLARRTPGGAGTDPT